jgi:quinol monooxygenase YgiN
LEDTVLLTARNVKFQIKAGKRDEFTRLFNDELIPMLKKQDGFRSELALLHNEQASAISIWKDSDSAMKYEKETYPQLVRRLEPVISGAPTVEKYEVAATTLS